MVFESYKQWADPDLEWHGLVAVYYREKSGAEAEVA